MDGRVQCNFGENYFPKILIENQVFKNRQHTLYSPEKTGSESGYRVDNYTCEYVYGVDGLWNSVVIPPILAGEGFSVKKIFFANIT